MNLCVSEDRALYIVPKFNNQVVGKKIYTYCYILFNDC